MIILTVEDEFLISAYLRGILESGGRTVIGTFDADELLMCWNGAAILSLSLLILTCRVQWTGSDWQPQLQTDGRQFT